MGDGMCEWGHVHGRLAILCTGRTYGALTTYGAHVWGAYHVRGAYQYMGVLLRKINFAESVRGAYRALRSVVVYGHTGGMRC